MRRRLVVAALAVTSTVVLAFLVPLGLLVREVARDRALTAAERDAGAIVPVLATTTAAGVVESAIDRTNAGQANRLSVFLPGGEVLGRPAVVDADVRLAREQRRAFSSAAPQGVAIFSPVLLPGGGAAIIRVLVEDAELQRGVVPSWVALAGVGLTLIGVGVFIADRLAVTVVRPVRDLSAAAGRIAGGDLGARVDPDGPTEVFTAGVSFNVLAERIVELLAAERELVADLSHRLRTPLTALRLDVEAFSEAEGRTRVLEDVDAVEAAVSEMIREARHPIRTDLSPACDLAAVLRERLGFWAALAEDQSRPWSVDVGLDRLVVPVVRTDLEAAIDVLVGNVFAHTPEGAGCRVRAVPSAGVVIVTFDDDGPGFETDVVERGRSGSGSTGLGLDIARRTASSVGGDLRISTRPGGGGRIEMTLPRTA